MYNIIRLLRKLCIRFDAYSPKRKNDLFNTIILEGDAVGVDEGGIVAQVATTIDVECFLMMS
ncbi:MAG: hypothetical protein Ct9H300mP29_1150 [Candidatus Neomarinimicrobiota bacterium]|nr:MAG: hypothetical protein Ct9H300mP29_1150 [Candidatus Neomarinimicrobiota bacterium]